MNRQKILELLSETIDTSPQILSSLPEDTLLTDAGLDSLSFIRFIVALEDAFHIEVLDSDLQMSNFRTLRGIFATLEKYFSESDCPENAVLKKVLVCDCDNCLWHGIAGEEDVYIDAPVASLHQTLMQLYESGILLCICSKNEPVNILKAFSKLNAPSDDLQTSLPRPDMITRPEHFVVMKINRRNKAENLTSIARELNLSTDSFVFIDDSDYELGLVNALLPEVTGIKADYGITSSAEPPFISQIRDCFGNTHTDLDRTKLYREQKEREKSRQNITNVEEYNATLETVISCDKADSSQAGRIAELSQRTNQCNLSCARYGEETVLGYITDPRYTVISLAVKDKFGDMGVVGAAVVKHGVPSIVKAFFLSCRAFDRGLEDILLGKIKELCHSEVYGIYVASEKNRRYAKFYETHGVTLYEKM